MVSIECTYAGKRYRVSFHGSYAISVQSVYRRKRRSADQHRTIWTIGMGEPSDRVSRVILCANQKIAEEVTRGR